MNKRKLLLQFIDIIIMAVILSFCAFVFPTIGSIHLIEEDLPLKIVVLMICIVGARCAFRIYSQVWRYANVKSYIKLILADAIGCGTFVVLSRIIPALNPGFSYAFICSCLIVLATLVSRFIYQLIHAKINTKKEASYSPSNKIKIAIIGAGNVGTMLADELIRNPRSRYTPYCFIDRDPQKVGAHIRGCKIYAENDATFALLKTIPVNEAVIAIPDATAEIKAELYTKYSAIGCKVKIYDYMGESSSHSDKRTLREFKIEDLLFRSTIQLPNALTASFYSEKTVLVTGGGGSIGSELCRQIVKQNPKKLIIFDIYENNAYEIQQDLLAQYGKALNLEVIIGSVRDKKRLDEVFARFRPEIVFHAAAHKHVPLMEDNPAEAVKNNVIGTYNTANVAEKYGVQKFLLISTDKAVNPTNIMGASKRLCEMVVQCRVDSKTEFSAVRFGNVLGSNGSVIPLFTKQIAAGGPVTVTDKRVTRYFMTIPEAVQLVLEAGAMAKNGELFVLDMGKPVKIIELAENMIRLLGFTPYQDIDIVEVGLRPGEKLYEELLMKGEDMTKTENELIFIERDKACSREEVDAKLNTMLASIPLGRDAIFEAFRKTVPTYIEPIEAEKRMNKQTLMIGSSAKAEGQM